MPLLDDFILTYFSDSEIKELNKLFDETDVLEEKHLNLDDGKVIANKIKELTSSDLEIGETQQERSDRIETLKSQYNELIEKHLEYRRQLQTIDYKVDSIRKEAYFRYSQDKTVSEILQDCFEIIDSIGVLPDDQGPDEKASFVLECDIQANRLLDLKNINYDTPIPEPEPPIIQYSHTIGQQVNWYLEYFNGIGDGVSFFKILKQIYDKTLSYFPDGLTDQDKQNKYCIFDQKFFQSLDAWNQEQTDKSELKEFEFDLLSNIQPDIERLLIPSTPKVRHTMFALGYLGTEPHQMTIDDYLQVKTVNDLVTFKGLDDDGLQFVFNENAVDKDKILVSFKNLENARGGGTAPSVVFAMVLEKMNKLGFFKYKTVTDTVTISVKELIEKGDYANWRSAKRALEQALKTCSELMINFSNKYTGKEVNTLWFSSIGWKDKGTLILSPNKDVIWKVIGAHFAFYPIYLYKLKTHAYKLAYYIFTQARIKKTPDKKGEIVFKISLTIICRELGLPSTTEIKKDYKKLILDKIISAMKEIEDADTKHDENRLVSLKLDIKKNQTAKEIIESGYLVVTLKKSYITDGYQMIRDREIELIEANRKKKEKAKRQAKEKSDQP